MLVLLTLQTSFLLPPAGYALMMIRGTLKEAIATSALARSLVPFLIVQWIVLATVLFLPQLTHLGENAADATRAPATPLSPQELNRRLEEMLPPPVDLDPVSPK